MGGMGMGMASMDNYPNTILPCSFEGLKGDYPRGHGFRKKGYELVVHWDVILLRFRLDYVKEPFYNYKFEENEYGVTQQK